MRNQPPTEIEYKFLLQKPGVDKAILDSLGSAGCVVEIRRKIRQEDIYLDTFDWRLFRRGLALRLRRAYGKSFYTLKNLGKITDGKAERREIEAEVKQHVRDPAALISEDILREIADIIYPRRLMAQLALQTEREPCNILSANGAEIEIVFDSTGFQALGFNQPHRANRLFEIEIELKKGAPASLESIATNIGKAFNLPQSPKSKLEAAIERLGIRFPAKNPPAALVINGDDRFDVAAQKILSFQLSRLQQNIPGAVADIDTEFVHQARVATRRMRTMIRLFRGAIPERSTIYFAGELFWLASLFGAVRDLDVFMLNLPKFLAEIELAPQKVSGILLRQIQEERRSLLADLKAGLTSARFRIFSLRLSTFAKQKPAVNPLAPLALTTVDKIAHEIISARLEEVMKRGSILLRRPKLKNYHKLRIEFKKLRYASEFFNSAFSDRLSPFIVEVVKIQDCLGELQDTVFTKRLIEGLLKKWKGGVLDPLLVFTLGEIYQLQQKISLLKQSEFNEIWKQFDSEDTRRKVAAALQVIQKGPE
jgi:inorganic triphosphatase YgiF